MPLVCFFGPDGSGKTTLARGLAEDLASRGFKVKVSWMRGTHTLASLLAKLLVRFKSFGGLDNPYYYIRIPNRLRRVWQFIEFVSALPIILVRFTIPSTLGTYVIAERFVLDFIVWVVITTNDRNYPDNLEARFLVALASGTGLKVYTTASFNELSKRSGGNINFLRKQRRLYDMLAVAVGANKIDTTSESVKHSLSKIEALVGLES